MNKKTSRIKRAIKNRIRLKKQNKTRLCVHRTPKHIYAQVISFDGNETLVSASTLDSEVKAELAGSAGNKGAAELVGKYIAQRALDKGIDQVSFDRSGFKYHGRVQALAESARSNGLKF